MPGPGPRLGLAFPLRHFSKTQGKRVRQWHYRQVRKRRKMFDCEACEGEFQRLSDEQTVGRRSFCCVECHAEIKVSFGPPLQIIDKPQYHMLVTAAGKNGTAPGGGFLEFVQWLKNNGIRFKLHATIAAKYHGHPGARFPE